MPSRTLAESEQFWRDTLSHPEKASAFTRRTLLIMAIFFAVITAPLVVLAGLGIRPWVEVLWMFAIAGVGLLCIYAFLRYREKHGGQPRPGHPIGRNRQR